ncbi:ABC transporter substrate-binding protein [Nocardia crassostreae]|uniref:ABC transporter substrate-binding protein n=1 Tax=Nocardia crassostreae TaxID=53428 RepID=UPI0008331AED|nr:spermidine/putrescine ABC transporter substrate-binding protein [Nocardia crassostreae]
MNKSSDSLPPALRGLFGARPTRRGLIRGGALLAAAGTLAACGTKGSSNTGAGACTAPVDTSALEKTVNFSNWPGYLDEDPGNAEIHPTMAEFTAKTGIKVDYVADVNDNNEFWGKVSAQLAARQNIERDIMVLSDSTTVKVVRQGFTQKYDRSKMPNFSKNLAPMLRNTEIDPDNDRMVPWQSGLVGIGVNTNVTGEVRTIDELLTRPDLKGKVVCLTEMPDTMGLMLHSLGKSAAKFTDDDFDNALAKLQKAVQSGHIRKFTGNEYVQDLAKGDIAACMAWSGDVIQLTAKDEKIKFISPDEGAMLYSDEALIPITSSHAESVMKLLDYYYDPAVAARLSAFVNYVCPVAGAQEEMAKFDPELAKNELIFPSAATQKKLKVFMLLDEAKDKDYQSKFQTVTGA